MDVDDDPAMTTILKDMHAHCVWCAIEWGAEGACSRCFNDFMKTRIIGTHMMARLFEQTASNAPWSREDGIAEQLRT